MAQDGATTHMSMRTGIIFEGGWLKGAWAPPVAAMTTIIDNDGDEKVFYGIDRNDRVFAALLGLDLSSTW